MFLVRCSSLTSPDGCKVICRNLVKRLMSLGCLEDLLWSLCRAFQLLYELLAQVRNTL